MYCPIAKQNANSVSSTKNGMHCSLAIVVGKTGLAGSTYDVLHIRCCFSLEECDDKNVLDGDGCSIECRIEENFNCKGQFKSYFKR